MKNLYVRLSANVGEFRQQMAVAGQSTRQFGRELDQAATSSKQAFQQIGKAGVVAGGLIIAGLAAATVAAARFEQGMRNANSIMQQSESELRATSAAVLDLSRKVPQSATTLADGLYDIASSGFAGAEGLQVLEASAIAATAGMTDTATAAKAITAVLNAYGLEASEAGRVSDVMFQAVNVGVVTFEELAQTIGDYTSTAAALGVTVEETSAALATMTLAGINAAESGTALNRVLSSFIKPSEAMQAAMRGLGYESGEAMLKALGLKGSVEAIDQVAGGSVAAIAAMYGEVRAIKGALSLAAVEGRNYANSTDAMETASDGAGAAMEAYNEQSKAFLVQLDLAKSSLTAVAIEMGSTFLPVLTSGAKVVGNVADAISSLPGPVKTVTVVAIGLAGAITLVGGAAILAVPKVVAFNAAVASMKAGPAAAGLTKLSGAMAIVGKAGVVAAVVTTAAMAIDYLGNTAVKHMADAPPAINLLTQALVEMANKGKPAGEVARAFGADLKALADDVKNAAKDNGLLGGLKAGLSGGGIVDQVVGAFTGKNPAIEEAEQNVKALNEAFKELFAQDPAAATEAWQSLVAEWEAGGGDVADLIVALPEVTAGLDANEASAAAAQAEMARLTEEAASLGINLDASSDLLQMTAEEMDALRAATDPLIFAMLEAGTVTKEQAEAMQKDLESFVQSVQQSFAEVTSPLAIYGNAVEAANETAKESWDKAGKDSSKFVERTSISLEDFVGAMRDTVSKTQRFADGITQAIKMGYDPQLVASLLEAGPEQAGPMLETLLSDHSGRMVGMVNDSVAALREVNAQVVEMARLTHLATTSTTDEMVQELGTAMAIAQQKAALGAAATGQAIATALNLKLADVRRVAELYGIELAKITSLKDRSLANIEHGMIGRNSGGPVPGVGDTDTVPALLTPGEFVLRKSAVAKIGLPALFALNQFNEGGPVMMAAGGLTPGMFPGGRKGEKPKDQWDVTTFARSMGAISDADWTRMLRERLAAFRQFSTEWQGAYQELARFNDEQAEKEKQRQEDTSAFLQAHFDRRLEIARNEHEAGVEGQDDYLDMLDEAIAQHDRYTDEWVQLTEERARATREGSRANREAIEREKEAAEAAADRLEAIVVGLANVYGNAQQRFAQQQAEYERLVESTRTRVVGELATVYERAQARFAQQGEDMQRALIQRNDKMRAEVERLRSSIADPLRETGDLLGTFGRTQSVSGDEIVAMLQHRVEAATEWNDVLRQLQAGGLDRSLVTRLAQAGPAALGLARGLQSVDPQVVNAAMAQLDAMGEGLANIFQVQEEAAIAAQVAAETPLPEMREFNQLLAEETRAWQATNEQRRQAQLWAETQAYQHMPAITFHWRTFNDLLAEETAAQTRAMVERREAEAWAGRMLDNVQDLNAELRELIRLLDEQARKSMGPATNTGAGWTGTPPGSTPGGTWTGGQGSVYVPPGTTIQPGQKFDPVVIPGQGIVFVPKKSYDEGGFLPMGLSLAYNGTGRPEPVGHHLTANQGPSVVMQIDARGATDPSAIVRAGEKAAEGLRKVLAAADAGVR